MIQRGKYSCLTFKSRNALRITGEGFGKKFDRNPAAQLRIRGLIHVAHPAGTKVGRDLEMGESGAYHLGFQFCRIVIGDVTAYSVVTLIKNRPSAATSYCGRM